MGSSVSFTNWWGKVCVLLDDPRLRWTLIVMTESDELVYTTKQLATRVTERRRQLSDDCEGSLDATKPLQVQVKNETHALSTRLRTDFERLGLVQRPAKAQRDDQSIIFITGWLHEFLARQNLQERELIDLKVDDRGLRAIEYLEQLDEERGEASTVGDIQPRYLPSMEAVLYAYIDECATLRSPDIRIAIGNPESLGEADEAIFEALYEDTATENRAAPMPKLPQHRDYEDRDKFLDYAIVGEVNGVTSVQKPRQLRDDIEGQLLTWTAGALEVYARSGDVDTDASPELNPADADARLPDDVIDRRAAEIVKSTGVDSPADRFGLHATIPDEAEQLRFGLYLRSNIDTDEPIPSAQVADAEAEDD